MNFLRFPELGKPGLVHGFTLRSEPVFTSVGLPAILSVVGLSEKCVMAEQTHGREVALVGRSEMGNTVPAVDALITREKNVPLVIRVADCGPIWLYCGKTEAIGLVHSGKKGTEAGVVPATIQRMRNEFGSEPRKMLALLGPCIRLPHYEVDFASEIIRQLRAEKVGKVVDSGLCTGADLKRFYSYRVEKGQTGRHFALLAMRSAGV